jgi:carbamoyl-phosphate synthase large subunit
VHAALALREDGYETIMVNCNPETVSTDYDTSDRLYFEPLTLEDVLEIVAVEKPLGVIVQYGGQTPLKLAQDLDANGVPIIGTNPDMIDCAEDRERFQKMLTTLWLKQPPNRSARTEADALRLAGEIGYPLVVRPSYVLGGRAMEIVHEQKDLERYMREAVKVSNDSPVLLDRFLSDATEVDVDAASDGEHVLIGGVMEHIEQAGVHSGDSACSLPPHSLSAGIERDLRRQTVQLAHALKVVGLMNVQFAIQRDVIYVLEVNPRASHGAFRRQGHRRSARKNCGALHGRKDPRAAGCARRGGSGLFFGEGSRVSVRQVSGRRYHSRSRDEIDRGGDGRGEELRGGFRQIAARRGREAPRDRGGVHQRARRRQAGGGAVARELLALGFRLLATRGTAGVLAAHGIAVTVVNKVVEGRPHIVDMIKNGDVSLVVNTVEETRTAVADSRSIRTSTVQRRVTYYTTVAGARAA